MADNINYDLFQKVEKWTTKEKFNALGNLTEIETGTEYNLAGAIDETDLASDLQTKINGKLTAPTTPTADSAVTMLADGTVGTKPLSEIGGKLYLHRIKITFNSEGNKFLDFKIYSTSDELITASSLSNTGAYIANYVDNTSNQFGVISASIVGTNVISRAAVYNNSNLDLVATIVSFTDTYVEL